MSEKDDSEKTEEPTSKKLDDAQKKGDVPKSQEVNTWFVLLATTLVIGLAADATVEDFSRAFRVFLESPHDIAVDSGNLLRVWQQLGTMVLTYMTLPMTILLIGAATGALVQHAPVFSAENMKPKLSKISPMAGLKRLFSAKSLMNFAKGILKLVLVGTATFLIVWPMRDQLLIIMTMDISALLPFVQSIAVKILMVVLAIMIVVAAVDFIFERVQWNKKRSQRRTQADGRGPGD